MNIHTYQMHNFGTVEDVRAPGSYTVRLDLGFRVFRLVQIDDPDPASRYPVGSPLNIEFSHSMGVVTVLSVEPATIYNRSSLYRYPGTVVRVVDGDTLDASVELGFNTTIVERFRLSSVAAPEIYGVDAKSRQRELGLRAREFTQKKINDYGGVVHLITGKRGKWRRWLAWVVLDHKKPSLNAELVMAKLARFV